MNADLVYLVQTDTTVGFLSQNKEKLARIKQRDIKKPILKAADSFQTLKNISRVPKKYRKKVRRSRLVTYIYPNGEGVRVVKDKEHLKFIKKFGWVYSTSANQTSKAYDDVFAKENCDVIVRSSRGFFEKDASSIVRLGKKRVRKIR